MRCPCPWLSGRKVGRTRHERQPPSTLGGEGGRGYVSVSVICPYYGRLVVGATVQKHAQFLGLIAHCNHLKNAIVEMWNLKHLLPVTFNMRDCHSDMHSQDERNVQWGAWYTTAHQL